MRKILALFLSAAMTLSLAALPAQAEKDEAESYISLVPGLSIAERSGGLSLMADPLTDEQVGIIEDAVKSDIEAGLDTARGGEKIAVHLGAAQIEYNNENAGLIFDVINNFLSDRPEYFYVTYITNEAGRIPLTVSRDENGNFGSITVLQYVTYDNGTIKDRIAAVEAQTDYIMNQLEANGADDSEFDTALWLFDYIVNTVIYDETYTNRTLDTALLGDRTTVCAGYAAAYKYLLRKYNIECMSVYHDPIAGVETAGHEWVAVKLGGNWYHADPTFADPMGNHAGNVDHKYFLCKDEEIIGAEEEGVGSHSDPYTNAGGPTDFNDDTYVDSLIHNIDTAVAFIGGDRYYAGYNEENKKSYIYKLGNQLTVEEAYPIDAYWYIDDTGRTYIVGYMGGIGSDGKYLYFNTGTTLERLDIKTASENYNAETGEALDSETIYTVPTEEGSAPSKAAKWFGSCVADGYMYYTKGTMIQTADNRISFSFEKTPYKFRIAPYHVSFVTNCDATVEAQTVEIGGKVIEPENMPERAHYTFGGWYTDASCSDGYKWDFSAAVTEDMVLYAKWTRTEAVVTFMNNTEKIGESVVNIGGVVTMPEYFEYGKVVTGWTTDEAGTAPWDFDTDTVENDMTLYVQTADADWNERDLIGLKAETGSGLITGHITASITGFNPDYQEAPSYILAIYDGGALTAMRKSDDGVFNITKDDGIVYTNGKTTVKVFAWNDAFVPYLTAGSVTVTRSSSGADGSGNNSGSNSGSAGSERPGSESGGSAE